MILGFAVTLDDVDVSCHAYEPVSVTWGRVHPGDSFEPRRCVVGFDAVANPQRGQVLRVLLNAPQSNPQWQSTPGTWASQTGTWAQRRRSVVLFSGRITDTSASWEPIVPHVQWGVVVDVIAVDPVADLSRLPVGDTPWPQETITQRAQRIEALTPLTWVTDPSAAVVLARDVDLQPALDLLDALAHSGSLAGGVFYDPNSDRARFALDALRGSRAPDLILNSCEILKDANEFQTVADVVNDVTVTYRNPADLNAAPSVRVQNPSSQATNGRRQRTVSTDLISSALATQRANTELTRFAVAADQWQQVILDSRVLTSAGIAEQVLAALPGLRVRLSQLVAPSDDTWDGYLEGWAFTGYADRWAAEVNLSPATWSGPLLPWSQAVKANTLSVNANPSFEATPFSAGWELFWRATGTVTEAITDGTAPDGTAQARVRAGAWQRLQMRNIVAVAPGQVWHAKYWARASVAGGYTFLRGVGAPPSGTPQYFSPGSVVMSEAGGTHPIPADNIWREYETTLTIPATVTQARFDLEVGPPSGSNADVDNVRFFLPTALGAWSDVVPTWRWMDAVDEIAWRS